MGKLLEYILMGKNTNTAKILKCYVKIMSWYDKKIEEILREYKISEAAFIKKYYL